MNILIVGSGGREHALGWSLKRDDRIHSLFFAPGNAGTSALGTNLEINADDVPGLVKWAEANRPNLTVVGPEAPLCLGLVDEFTRRDLPVFGPNREAAQLEGSKVFAKELFLEAGIPTARSRTFDDPEEAGQAVTEFGFPLVIKADGLASGKGVLICQNESEALDAIESIMAHRVFGTAGARILMEEFLEGDEASIHVITDGTEILVFPASQDHKRIFDGDRGPNTGGMGAYAPAPVVQPELLKAILEQVFRPLLKTFKKRGIEYRGVLYGGLMLTADGPKVLEFNCRFGDPETQVILPLLETPLLDILLATVRGELGSLFFTVSRQSALTVVIAAPGYPEKPETGIAISGLSDWIDKPEAVLFHAGTRGSATEAVTSGGRVLACTGLGANLKEAKQNAYTGVGKIQFPGAHFRQDIGHRAL